MRVDSVEKAYSMVEREIARVSPIEDDEWTVVRDATIEKPWGWVVFYTSRRYLETRDFRHAAAGNAPIIVEKETGRLLPTGTAMPVHEYVANYERTGNPHG